LKLRAGISIASLLLFCSCVANTVLGDAHNAENNVSRLSRVSLRMDKETVLRIMHAPYDKEVFRIGEDRYEVWFYVTSSTVLGQSRMVPRNMTPLTFRDQVLVGFGYDYYYWLKRGGETRTFIVDENEAMENKDLERELEKSIQPTSTNSQPPQTSPSKGTTTPPNQTPGPASPAKGATPPTNQNPVPSSTPTTPRTPTNGPSPTNPKVSPSPPPKGPAQNPIQETGPRTNPPKPNPPPKQPPPKSNPVSMSKPPEKPPQKPKPETSDQPEWDKKDEEMNEDAMDQDFDFW